MPRIVIVEDEILIGVFVQETLRDAGFSVDFAADAKSCLSLFDRAADAAVIDVGLPDLTGDQLTQQLRQVAPSLPIVLTTGYDHHLYEALFASDERIRILGKPFDAPQLVDALSDMHVTAAATVS
jgi:DNA-binding response OmpR family regulator